MDDWIPCSYIHGCYIQELKDAPYKPYLVTYLTGKMQKELVDVAWVDRGRVLNKKFKLITAYMPMPKPYKG